MIDNNRHYVTITATSKSNTTIKRNFIVYIQNIKLVTSIEITTNKGNNPIIGIGDFGLKAVIAKMYPGNYGSEDTGIEYSTASDKRVEWHSSNRNILDIDEDGNVITNEVSEITTVDIYCIAKDGSNITSNRITVTIDPSIEPEETIEPIEGEPNV